MRKILIKDATLVNEGKVIQKDLLIKGETIASICDSISPSSSMEVIDAKGLHLLPGWIDDQVHFREPGLTHKATIASESRAAVAGGITSFLEMPNTIPQTTDSNALLDKHAIAEKSSIQDGKIRRTYQNQSFNFRCSTAPGKYGEKMVLRYLKADSDILNLDTLISNEDVRASFRKIMHQANGIVIVSGPTGSGKSTTLASALREKDTGELNIVTA